MRWKRAGRRRPPAEPLPVGELMARWLSAKHLTAELRQYTVWHRWRELVGERVAAHARPQSLRAGLLTVAVSSSAWLNELNFLKAELVARINATLGEHAVRAVRLFAGVVRQPREPLGRAAGGLPTAPIRAPSPAELDLVERDGAQVSDDELRRAIGEARIAHLRWKAG